MLGLDLTAVDLWRVLLMTVSAWLSVLALRLGYLRYRQNSLLPKGARGYNPTFYVAGAMFLAAVVILRPKHFGQPPTLELWVLTPCVATMALALLPRAHVLRPRRRR